MNLFTTFYISFKDLLYLKKIKQKNHLSSTPHKLKENKFNRIERHTENKIEKLYNEKCLLNIFCLFFIRNKSVPL